MNTERNIVILGPQGSGKTRKALELVKGTNFQQMEYLEISRFPRFSGVKAKTTHLIIEGVPNTPAGISFLKFACTTHSLIVKTERNCSFKWAPVQIIFTGSNFKAEDFVGARRLKVIETFEHITCDGGDGSDEF